jgi:heme exporter protein B
VSPVDTERSLLGTLVDAWRITEKDLKIELRTKEIVLTMGYFGFLVVLIFAFSFFRDGSTIASVAAGILWVAIAFSGTLGLGRVFEREREGDCIRALLLSPVPRSSIYLGKALGVLIFMIVVELVVVPTVYFFFNLDLAAKSTGLLIGAVLLGTVGYSIIGTLLGAMLIRARAKDVLLAIVLYPMILPVLIIGVKATGALLEPQPAYNEVGLWLRILGLYDLVFGVAALWVFEPLLMD